MANLYGVETDDKNVSAIEVRDAIVECFKQAHKEQLDEMKEYVGSVSSKDLEELQNINIKQLVRSMFKRAGGDYDNPTKESIIKALDGLKEYSANFRNQEIIQKHYGEMISLLEALK